MTLFSYVVRWDHGFAPNPFFGSCTVATCKPDIRKIAREGDFVLGTGSAERKLAKHAVFFMQIAEVTTFDEYWADQRFARKVPVMNGSLEQRFGDNIYHSQNGEWLQADSRHSRIGSRPNFDNLHHDTDKTDRVLIGTAYTYWGGDGPKLPASFSKFVQKSPGYRSFFTDAEIAKFVDWIWRAGPSGTVGDPGEWKYEKYWR